MSDEHIDQKYSRVTNILYPFSGLRDVNIEILQNAADRGTRVHKACEAIIDGLGYWGVDEDIQGYIHSFELWWGDGYEVIEMEKRFFCDDLLITGQADLILKNPSGGCYIVDIKTPQREGKTWPLQGSAYAYLARRHGHDIREIMFVRLDRYGGTPELYKYKEDFGLFLKVLDIYNLFFKRKKNGIADCPDFL